MNGFVGTALGATIAALISTSPGSAADPFAGKTITISVHTGPGGGFDAYVRMLARHMGRHIAGAPTIVVANQPGGGGLLSLNYLARLAPQDGTWFGIVSQSLILHEVTGQPGLQVSLAQLNWVGNMTQSNYLVVTRPDSRIRTIGDAIKTEALFGSSGVGATSSQLPNALNVVLGARFKVVHGYKGTGDTDLAIARGELDGRIVSAWPSYRAAQPVEVRDKINILLQIGNKKDPDIPASVPLLTDLVNGNPEKEPIAQFLTLTFSMSRPLATGPGVPADRVAILRRAFDTTLKDEAFLADARKINAEIDPMTGEEVQRAVGQILASPKSTIDAVRAALGG